MYKPLFLGWISPWQFRIHSIHSNAIQLLMLRALLHVNPIHCCICWYVPLFMSVALDELFPLARLLSCMPNMVTCLFLFTGWPRLQRFVCFSLQVDPEYTEKAISVSSYPLSAALTCAKLCNAFEEVWGIVWILLIANYLCRKVVNMNSTSVMANWDQERFM